MSLAVGPIPLYYQLETILRSRIVLGEWSAGQKIPTEVEIAEKYGVSVVTVKQSLAALVADGLISRKRGKGTYVERTEQGERFQPLIGSLTKAVVSEVGATEVKVFDFQIGRSSIDVAKHLLIENGKRVLSFKRLHYYHSSEPFSFTINYIKEDIGKMITAKDVAESSVFALLRGKCAVNIGCARQIIRAMVADDYLAKQLSVNMGFPILKIERMVYDIYQETVQYVEIFYRADRYIFRAELTLDEKWERRKKTKYKGL